MASFDYNAMFCLVCKEAAAVDTTVRERFYLQLVSIKLQEESRNHKSLKGIVAAKNS